MAIEPVPAPAAGEVGEEESPPHDVIRESMKAAKRQDVSPRSCFEPMCSIVKFEMYFFKTTAKRGQ
jgi:hypothetical protein